MNGQKRFYPGWSRQAIELAVFLFLIVPSLILSFFVVRTGSVSFVFTAVATILRDLALVALVLYFVWGNGEPLSHLGLRVRQPWRDIVIGAILFIPFFFFATALDTFLVNPGLHAPKTPLPSLTIEKGWNEVILASILVLVVAFSEETIFRGYLMLRFMGTTGSGAWAVILSSVVFSLGHGYEGSAGVVTVGFMGAVFALIYLWRGNLLAPMTIHFLQDFISIVLPVFISGPGK